MSWIIFGLIGGATATALGTLSLRTQKRARTDGHGWKSLRPGWYLHFLLIGCLAFACAIGYFFWAGGSALPDGAEQNVAALCLFLAFGGAGIWVYLSAYARKIAWTGEVIRIRSPWRREVFHRLGEIADICENATGTECRIRFADGQSLTVSVYFDGFHDFMDDLDNFLRTGIPHLRR